MRPPHPRAPDDELRLGAAVLAALDLEGCEREAYLRDLASADAALVAEVRRRLAAGEAAADSFLEVPAATRLQGSEVDDVLSAALKLLPEPERYELGECLGEGGMGQVFKAFDHQLGRPVALKLLTREDPEIRRLFLREAQSQARIQHPHVLEIYDRGELDGRPYIAMRYVAGGTLADTAPGLSLEQKVRLLVQVAEGLHAAHRQGLLHRDVKPSNVLVDRNPDGELVALVSDFGLAADLGEDDAAAAEAVAGSPHFIAPERLAGSRAPADRRSDVYSLGITIYWVLTGSLPFAGERTVTLLHRVLREDPPTPRQHLPSLPAELEAVILRCIARRWEERYASARAVAQDLRRYLEGEVVEAYAAGLAYRLTRFALRNRALVALAAAAAAAVLVAAAAVAAFAVRSEAARQRVELRQRQAEELIRFMVVDLRDKLDSLGRLDVLTAAGDAALEYFAAVPEAELSEEELLRRSQVLTQVGDVRIRLGDLAGAAAPMAESLVLSRRLADLAPHDDERLFGLGQSHYWVGFVGWERGDLAAARESFSEYLEISRRLVDRAPANPRWRRELSYAHSNLGSLREAEGDYEAALEHFLTALAFDRELATDPANEEARSELAASHNTVGRVLQDLGRLAEAEDHLRTELALRRSLLAAAPHEPRRLDFLATGLSRLGSHLSTTSDRPAATELLEEARSIFSELVAHDPANTAWKFKLAWVHLHLGRAAFADGVLEAAEAEWGRARQTIDELLASGPSRHAWTRTRAAGLYHQGLLQAVRGQRVQARSTAVSAVGILEELAATRPTDRDAARWLAQSLLLLGSLERSPGAARLRFDRAEEVLAPIARGSRDVRVVAPWAAALRCLGRFAEAGAAQHLLAEQTAMEPGLDRLCGGAGRGGTGAGAGDPGAPIPPAGAASRGNRRSPPGPPEDRRRTQERP